LYVSRVTYRHYHAGPAFNDEVDSFMHKRKEFSAEKELRLLLVDDAHFGALFIEPSTTAELPEYRSLNWSVADAITKIVLSPYADEPSEQQARAAIEAEDASLRDRIILSDLNPRQCAPWR
jgi:hypothetical protein